MIIAQEEALQVVSDDGSVVSGQGGARRRKLERLLRDRETSSLGAFRVSDRSGAAALRTPRACSKQRTSINSSTCIQYGI